MPTRVETSSLPLEIRFTSQRNIRTWSFGEVKKPETINSRTYRPEKDGLFCERIFGPEKDWECACGKYRGMKYKGMICDRCGVKITQSRVRRKRMGHVELATPVVHIWFFKPMPSRLGALLDMKTTSLEKIIYFHDYVVVDPGSTPLKHKQLLTEEEFRKARMEYRHTAFKADMGAEAIYKLLTDLDLVKLSQELRTELLKTNSKEKKKGLINRLKIVEAIRDSDSRPEWMVLDVIPVIPPDLRPLVLLGSGNFATSDLNELYGRIIDRNNSLRKLIEFNASEVILRNEKRMLQEAVDALFDRSPLSQGQIAPADEPHGVPDVSQPSASPVEPIVCARDDSVSLVTNEYELATDPHTPPSSQQIEDLYAELAELTIRQKPKSPDEELNRLIRERLLQLRQLQNKEADEIERRFRQSLSLPFGEAARLMSEADKLERLYANPRPDDTSTDSSDHSSP